MEVSNSVKDARFLMHFERCVCAVAKEDSHRIDRSVGLGFNPVYCPACCKRIIKAIPVSSWIPGYLFKLAFIGMFLSFPISLSIYFIYAITKFIYTGTIFLIGHT